MERENSLVATGEVIREPRAVIERTENYGRPAKKGSAWTPFFVVAIVALVAWLLFWKMNVAGMRPVVASAFAPVAASVTAAAIPEPTAPEATKAPAKPTQGPAKRTEAHEPATPGLDALLAKLNRFLGDSK